MYVQSNNEGRNVQTILQWKSNRYYLLSVIVALSIQHELRMCRYYTVICGQPALQ
jgi:hypothetical protein